VLLEERATIHAFITQDRRALTTLERDTKAYATAVEAHIRAARMKGCIIAPKTRMQARRRLPCLGMMAQAGLRTLVRAYGKIPSARSLEDDTSRSHENFRCSWGSEFLFTIFTRPFMSLSVSNLKFMTLSVSLKSNASKIDPFFCCYVRSFLMVHIKTFAIRMSLVSTLWEVKISMTRMRSEVILLRSWDFLRMNENRKRRGFYLV
jgi:hypothetical protein